MAQTFDDGSNQYFEDTNANVTATPLSLVCWFNSDDITIDQYLVGVYRSTGFERSFCLIAGGNRTSDVILARAYGGIETIASSSSGYSANTWHHAGAVFVGDNSRFAYINGVPGSENTDGQIPVGIDRTSIGRNGSSSPFGYMSGSIAEAAIWNVVLTDAEMAWLAKGYSPLTLTHRLANLVEYKDLIRNINRPGIGVTLTAFGSPTAGDHSRVLYPKKNNWAPFAVAAAAGGAARIIFLTGEI